MLRNVICWMLIAVTPASLVAADADSGAAMLYGRGPVWLNGKPLPRSSAVFPGDLIQTQPESLATLDASGSGVIVLPDSLVKFEANAVSLEHGGVSVATSKGMVAIAREITITPASNTWTEFEVADANGTVQVVASKGEVNVNCGKGTATLSEGEQATRDESGNCKKRRKGGAPVQRDGILLTDPDLQAGALIIGGALVCLLLCHSSKPFVSQWKP
ncbi:MAG TPA: hypothetical protein VN948_16740 [Terriglobales bacterium]|nr:hypothetical protein [Terriglobales bacterium]